MAKTVIALRDAQQRFAVNRANQHEGIWQPVYDYIVYPQAGSAILTFFQVPKGQGTARVGGGSKTLEDTNMEAAGSFPSPKHYLCVGIEVAFFSGAPVANGAAAIAGIGAQWSDLNAVHKRGFLNLFIGSKSYLQDGPLSVFPQSWGLAGAASLAGTTTADTKFDSIEYARFYGKPYEISPVFIPATQNFQVTLEFPDGAVAVSAAGVVGVRLLGFQYRLSQ